MQKELVRSPEFRVRDMVVPALFFMRRGRRPVETPVANAVAMGRTVLFGTVAVASIAAASWITGTGPDSLIVASMFAGALVAGLAGFAFSAVAAALVMHWVAPITVVPLLLACSITTQLFSIANLRRTMQWRSCAPFLIGGLLGIPLGAALLRGLDPHRFAIGIGAFLMVYGALMLLMPGLVVRRANRLADIAFGVVGGITGGAIAFPGAAPTIWCSLRGLPKDVQRGIVQPFILVMQIAALIYFSRLGILTTATLTSFLVCAPAVLFGTWVGLRLFNRIGDDAFRRVVLIFLIVSGVSLML